MKFLDLMRKLGIFRSGSVSGKYTSAKDMPTELLMDDVYDAKKDLTTKEDLKKVGAVVASASEADPTKVGMGRKIFFWVVAVFGALLLIIFLTSGFSFRLILTLAIWFFFMRALRKFAFSGSFSWVIMIVLTFVVFLFSVVLYPGESGKSGSSGTAGQSLEQYDRKIYDIAGEDGKVKGAVALQVKENKSGKKYLSANYHFLIKDSFPMIGSGFLCNNANDIKKAKGYEYVGNLLRPKSEEKSDSVGAFSPAFCNKDAMPEDLFSSADSTYNCLKPPSSGTVTDTFTPNFSRKYDSLEEFLAANTYEVYDGSEAWVNGDKEGECSLDDDMAVKQGKKVRSYSFSLTERK